MPKNRMKKPESFLFAIFGGSGDLNKRKLMPALYHLFKGGLLPERFAILSLSRTAYTDDSFREKISESIAGGTGKSVDSDQWTAFAAHLHYESFDPARRDDFDRLRQRLSHLDSESELGDRKLFYLATPPELFLPIASGLGEQGLSRGTSAGHWRRIIIEKPFGRDLASALALNAQLRQYFAEEQLYRIDHYLGKETVQNILALRFANGIFEPLWNRNYIHHIEITAAEQLGVEERGGYYDTSGALRDMVQNHLLQVAATVAMEPPALFDDVSVRNEKVKVFQSLRPLNAKEIKRQVVRGQYIASTVRGEAVPGYRQEKNVAADSQTETFVAIKFHIDNWRWGGVPFYIRTGKRLPTRVTEVVVHFKDTPHQLFKSPTTEPAPLNQLILRIQPDEGILLKFGMKIPGAGFNIKSVGMDFKYSELADLQVPEAYERLLLDALLGDGTLYARADAVEAAWRFIDPILDAWKSDRSIKLLGYPAGTWGPLEASALFGDANADWRYPCKNLTGDDSYCEL